MILTLKMCAKKMSGLCDSSGSKALLFFVISLLLLAASQLVQADDWQTIRNCRLIDNESNDGDSFHVKADREERIFRLYFVDTPEANADDSRVQDRIATQAAEFGISEKESVEIGKKASAFTRAVLSRPFKATTCGKDAMGGSRLPRSYAFIETADGEDLGEMLVSRGLARSFGQVDAPPGKSVSALRSTYDRLEAKARRERLGAWGDGAATPTMELSSGSAKENSQPAPTRRLPSASPQTDPRIAEDVSADIVAAALSSVTSAIGQGSERVESVAAAEEERAPSSVPAPLQAAARSTKVSLNNATQAELEALPEIGPKVASDIIAGRPYASVEDIDRVQGIGPKKMEAIRPLLTE